MKRRGHLCLIGGTQSSVPQEKTLQLAGQLQSEAMQDAKYTAQGRMRDAENEMMAMKEVTDAAFMLMRSLPMEQLELNELLDLYDMFMSGVEVLELYKAELQQLSNFRLSPHELKQLSRLRKLHWHLSEIVPDAAESIEELVRKMEASKPKQKKVTAKSKKTAALRPAKRELN